VPRSLDAERAGPRSDQAARGGGGDAEDDLLQETKVEAEAQWAVVADAVRDKQPKLAAMMDASRDDVLAYMGFPREHWTQIASTNPLERVNREIKRRADVVGIFPNDGAITRLV
jgi:putative transposase